MKHKFGALVASIVSISGFLAAVVFAPAAYAAGTATMSLSPASGAFYKGHALSVKVYENSGGDTINAVQANLTYNPSQLKYVGYSDSSAMNIEAENPSGNNGSLHFARGTITAVTGTQEVVVVNFEVVDASGTATISFASGTSVVRSTDNKPEDLTLTKGTYTLKTTSTTSPAPSPSPSPTPSPSPSPTPATYIPPNPTSLQPNTSTTKTSGTKLTVTDVQSNNGSSTTGTIITWKTNRPSTSTVLYGSDKEHLLPLSDGKLVTSHSITLPADQLHSGGSYYFYVSSTDKSGNTVSSQLLPFIAAGDAVSSENGHKLSGQLFTIIGMGAVILAAVLILFSAYHFYQSRKQRNELAQHFPDLSPNNQINPGPTTFQASNGTPGTTTKPDSNQSNNANKGS